MKYEIAIIGVGEMGSWIAEQLVKKGIFGGKRIIVTRRNNGKLVDFAEKIGVDYSISNIEAAKNSKRILLAVRPQQMKEVVSEIAPYVAKSQIIFSVAVGLGIDFYEKFFPENQVVRLMPNPFIASNLGTMGYSVNGNIDNDTIAEINNILSPLCESLVKIDDDKMHLFSTMASCSSAIFWQMFDSIIEKAKEDGFDEKTAREITLISALASAKHSLKTDESMIDMINSAATPGGMTIEGVNYLRQNNFSENVKEALQKISDRSMEINRQFNK